MSGAPIRWRCKTGSRSSSKDLDISIAPILILFLGLCDISTMEVIEFGRRLLDTLDLDPVYVMLHRSNLSAREKSRFCVAYWLYYNTGLAAAMSEKEGSYFWEGVRSVFSSASRGAERRHFRGASAISAVDFIANRYKAPEDFVEFLASATPRSFEIAKSAAM